MAVPPRHFRSQAITRWVLLRGGEERAASRTHAGFAPLGTRGYCGISVDSTLVSPGAGGNGGGFLETRRCGCFPIGAATDVADAPAIFVNLVRQARVDLSGLAGTTSDVYLRFRCHDSRFIGWHCRLTDVLGGNRTTFSMRFDSGWSALQAHANGWETDLPGGFDSVGWAQTMSDVHTTEIRIDGTATRRAGINHFPLRTVPEPGGRALVAAAGLGLLAMRRRRVSRRRMRPLRTARLRPLP